MTMTTMTVYVQATEASEYVADFEDQCDGKQKRRSDARDLRISLNGDFLRITGNGTHASPSGKEYYDRSVVELNREALHSILDKAIKAKLVRLPEISDEAIKAKLVHLPGISMVAQAKRDLEQALNELGVADDTH